MVKRNHTGSRTRSSQSFGEDCKAAAQEGPDGAPRERIFPLMLARATRLCSLVSSGGRRSVNGGDAESTTRNQGWIWVPISSRMAAHMKTTIEIASPLLKEAKAVARSEGTTVRALIERGLKLVLSERRRGRPFKLRDASVAGSGLHPDAIGRSWDDLRARSYEGRGG
jgi:hypothetical protein